VWTGSAKWLIFEDLARSFKPVDSFVDKAWDKAFA
jgi:hypothetical protein